MARIILSDHAASLAALAIVRQLDAGFLRIYDGTIPWQVGPIAAQHMLVELRFKSPAFRDPVRGVSEAWPLSPAIAIATGRATWFRVLSAEDHVLFDGTVGPPGSTLVTDFLDLLVDAPVEITSFTYTVPR